MKEVKCEHERIGRESRMKESKVISMVSTIMLADLKLIAAAHTHK